MRERENKVDTITSHLSISKWGRKRKGYQRGGGKVVPTRRNLSHMFTRFCVRNYKDRDHGRMLASLVKGSSCSPSIEEEILDYHWIAQSCFDVDWRRDGWMRERSDQVCWTQWVNRQKEWMDRGREGETWSNMSPSFLCPLSLSRILNFFLLLKSRNDCNGKKEREGFIIERRIVIGRIEGWKMRLTAGSSYRSR